MLAVTPRDEDTSDGFARAAGVSVRIILGFADVDFRTGLFALLKSRSPGPTLFSFLPSSLHFLPSLPFLYFFE